MQNEQKYTMDEPISFDRIIHEVRGKRIILDSDLADIYQVTTKRLNEQVKRNLDRFPSDFLFQLNKGEYENLRSQIATSSYGGRRYLPYAFTEHGEIEKKMAGHERTIASVFIAIKRLMEKPQPEPIPKKRLIGFTAELE